MEIEDQVPLPEEEFQIEMHHEDKKKDKKNK